MTVLVNGTAFNATLVNGTVLVPIDCVGWACNCLLGRVPAVCPSTPCG